ncbi:MAG: efflux RND transporter periplasmic adaptor subunit [Verrucomicrobiota bacterium]|nr:efflux RND transporter periplasmic adaptor subunit [Verrucomicrobiota bacterium]
MWKWGLLFLLLVLFLTVGYLFFHRAGESNIITLYGNVDVRQVDIGFRVPGRVAAMPFEEGEFVAEGTLLSWLDEEPYGDEVLQARANVCAARSSLQNAKEIYQRRITLIESGSVSQEEYENARTATEVDLENCKAAEAALGVAETNLHDTKAYAPADSVILTRVREPGTVVLAADPVYTLSLVSPIWVRAFIAEPLLGKVWLGMKAEITTDAGRSYKGKLGFISPVAEFTPKTVETAELRTDLVYRVRIYADNPDWGLKQGMPVTVYLNTEDEHSNP